MLFELILPSTQRMLNFKDLSDVLGSQFSRVFLFFLSQRYLWHKGKAKPIQNNSEQLFVNTKPLTIL